MDRLHVMGLGLAMVLAPVLLGRADAAGGRAGYWERLPPAPGRSDPIAAIAIDEDGVLWLDGGTGCYVYHADSARFRKVVQPGGSGYQAMLHGGGPRGLFTSMKGEIDFVGRLYRLRHGQLHDVGDYRYFSPAYYPGLYVSRQGRWFNWSETFVAVRIAGQWRRHEAAVAEGRALPDALIFDAGETVYFFYQGKIFAIDAKGDLTIRETESHRQPRTQGVLWRGDRAILANEYGGDLQYLQLSTGAALDLPEPIADLTKNTAWSLFSDGGGVAYLYGHNREQDRRHLFRLNDDGSVTSLPSLAAAVDPHHHAQYPQSILQASGGALWIARSTQGIARWKNNRVTIFGAEEGVNLDGCRYLVEDRRGEIFAAAHRGLYRFRHAPPHVVKKVLHDRGPRRLAKIAWRLPDPAAENSSPRPTIRAAWRVGDAVAYLSTQPNTLQVVDTATGKPRFALRASDDPFAGGTPFPSAHRNTLALSQGGRITILNRHTGKEKQSTPYAADPRFAPVAIDDDWLVGTGYRASTMARIDAKGKELWTCDLPGYLQSQPVLCGATLVVQTRGSSYGGQATSGIDAASGELLWKDYVDAYGCGVAATGDNEFLVEADGWLSPERTEGWLIFRRVRTGQRLGELKREGGVSAPWVDRGSGRAYAVLGRSEVICFDGRRQRLIWETHLPEAAIMRAARTNGSEQVWEATELVNDRFLAIDQNNVVHVLDADHGQVTMRIAATAAFDAKAPLGRKPELLMMPWLLDGRMIVATNYGLVAYRLPKVKQTFDSPRKDHPEK